MSARTLTTTVGSIQGRDRSRRPAPLPARAPHIGVTSDSGEGGAGAFSDGKLYTRSTKRGDVGRILALFNFFGASESILTDAHPHIGTDKLPKIVNAMREKIISLGGEFHSCTKCVDFLTETENGKKRITGIAAEHTKTKEKRTIEADAVLLASGHSANDIYALVARCAPEALEAKTFAAGVRVEHPRELIDAIQFHGKNFHSCKNTIFLRNTIV